MLSFCSLICIWYVYPVHFQTWYWFLIYWEQLLYLLHKDSHVLVLKSILISFIKYCPLILCSDIIPILTASCDCYMIKAPSLKCSNTLFVVTVVWLKSSRTANPPYMGILLGTTPGLIDAVYDTFVYFETDMTQVYITLLLFHLLSLFWQYYTYVLCHATIL